MPSRRTSLPYPDTVIRNRPRQAVFVAGLVAAAAIEVWSAAVSPFDAGDVALYVVVFVPVLVVLYRLATERVTADPAADEVLIRNLWRSHRVAWDAVAHFDVVQGNVPVLFPREYVVCRRPDGTAVRVRAAGTHSTAVRGGFGTSHERISVIAQELNVRHRQHDYGLGLDELR